MFLGVAATEAEQRHTCTVERGDLQQIRLLLCVMSSPQSFYNPWPV